MQTSPTRKLPALFVLDSIVKNVGTPYTVYLGRNLYNTFMEAYTLVDTATRRHMDAMLKTWKEPVPGSIDPRPVFPRETVQPLENAMIKARAALEKIRQSQVPFQGTATPPQHNGQYARPPVQTPQQFYPGYGVPQQVCLHVIFELVSLLMHNSPPLNSNRSSSTPISRHWPT